MNSTTRSAGNVASASCAASARSPSPVSALAATPSSTELLHRLAPDPVGAGDRLVGVRDPEAQPALVQRRGDDHHLQLGGIRVARKGAAQVVGGDRFGVRARIFMPAAYPP